MISSAAGVVSDGQFHPLGRRRLGRGVNGVVQQVAEDGHQVLDGQPGHGRGPLACRTSSTPRSCASAALPMMRALEHRFLHGAHHVIRELLAELQVLGGEIQGLGRPPQFHQRNDRVEPVGVLVGLGPQGIGESAHGFQFAAQGLDLGAVADGGHGAEDRPGAAGRAEESRVPPPGPG